MADIQSQTRYSEFVRSLKEKIKHAKSTAVLSVNRQLIKLYFEIGREIVSKQNELGWGRSVVERMAKDLQAEFGPRSGYSSANLWRMRNFYLTYADDANLAQLVRDISWSHNILIYEKCKNPAEREYYIKNTIVHGWSRNVLMHHIKTELYRRDQKELKQHNFQDTLPAETSEMAMEMMKGEYNLGFLGISKEAKEHELESRIIENIKRFLLELGYGFSFIGSQYKLILEENEYFIDLLFFSPKAQCPGRHRAQSGEVQTGICGQDEFLPQSSQRDGKITSRKSGDRYHFMYGQRLSGGRIRHWEHESAYGCCHVQHGDAAALGT
jgi:predicted nuclease of restriction endonuclease-like (RecB) superfamily